MTTIQTFALEIKNISSSFIKGLYEKYEQGKLSAPREFTGISMHYKAK